MPTHKAAVRYVVMRILGAHEVAKDRLPSSFALYPMAPDQYAIAASGISEHGAKNRAENTDQLEVPFPGARATLPLLCILFLMAVPIAESCCPGHRLAQRLIGQGSLPGICFSGRWLLILGGSAYCEKIRQFRNHFLQILRCS